MRVSVPFQPRWRAMVLAGTKTTTVRTRRYGAVGDEFELEGRVFRLTSLEHMPLRDACVKVWEDEGMSSPDEFERVWRENHPTRGFRGDDTVWVHRFNPA